VAREDQASFLRSHGYKNVVSIGLPFIYSDTPKVTRSLGSVLIMPGHTLEEETAVSDFEEYVQFARILSDDLLNVVVCLHGIDYEKGEARKAFERAGFEVIRGAAVEDSNSLERMAFLFSRFEYVSTNFHGSHVYYAAAKGCKVSIAGPQFVPDLDGIRRHLFYRNFPDGISYSQQITHSKRRIYSFLYVSLKQSEPRVDWALDQLGYQEKKSPRELMAYLGWTRGRSLFMRQRRRLGKFIHSLGCVKSRGSSTVQNS